MIICSGILTKADLGLHEKIIMIIILFDTGWVKRYGYTKTGYLKRVMGINTQKSQF